MTTQLFTSAAVQFLQADSVAVLRVVMNLNKSKLIIHLARSRMTT